MPAVYIDEFVGLSNRLEALPLAFALAKHYGHEVVLDWRELDGFDVLGAKASKLWPWRKWGAVRVRDCTLQQFHALQHKPVICRSLDGPSEMLDPIYLEVAQRVRPKRHVLHGILNALVPYAHKPMVAVHIRQGDYALKSHTQYQTDVEWPAVPLPLYAAAMHQSLQHQPDAVFLVAHNGPSAPVQEALQGLPVVQLGISSPYAYKGPDHASNVHPMADLYALAACSVLIATPISGYSHWAANVLGGPSVAVVPRPGCTVEQPQFGIAKYYGKRMKHWREAGRTGAGVQWMEQGLTRHAVPSLTHEQAVLPSPPLACVPNLPWLFGLLNETGNEACNETLKEPLNGSTHRSTSQSQLNAPANPLSKPVPQSLQASPDSLAWATVQLRSWHPQVPKRVVVLGEFSRGLAELKARQEKFQAMMDVAPTVWLVLHAQEIGESMGNAAHSKLAARQWRDWQKMLLNNTESQRQGLSIQKDVVLMVDWAQYLGVVSYAEALYTDQAGQAALVSSMKRNVQLVTLT